MRIGRIVGNAGGDYRLQVHAREDAACSGEVKRERHAAALALAGRLAAVVLAGGIVMRNFGVRGTPCRRAVHGLTAHACDVHGRAGRGRTMHHGRAVHGTRVFTRLSGVLRGLTLHSVR